MAIANDVVPIERLREGLGIAGDENDSTLVPLRDAAIGQVERFVSRNIITRTGIVSTDLEFVYRYLGGAVDALSWRIPDVTGLTGGVKYRALGADPGGTLTTAPIDFSSSRVVATDDLLFVYSEPGSEWRTLVEFDHPAPSVTVSVGMADTAIPAQWREAVILIVRQLYDGSAFDDVAENSPVAHLLAAYRRWAGDR